jgi:hypothetical protein
MDFLPIKGPVSKGDLRAWFACIQGCLFPLFFTTFIIMPLVTFFLKHVPSLIDLFLYVWFLAPSPHCSCSFVFYLTLAGIYELVNKAIKSYTHEDQDSNLDTNMLVHL